MRQKFSMILLFVLPIALVIGQSSFAVQPDKKKDPLIGKEVMTIKWNAEFKLERKTVNQVDLGRVFRVDNVNGAWLHVMGKSGWIAQRDTVPIEKALLHFETELRKTEPGEQADAYHNRGLCLNGLQQFDKAIADFDKAIELNPKMPSYYNSRAFAKHRKGDLDDALKDYNTAIKMNKKDAAFLSNRGILYRDMGEYKKAGDDYAMAIKLSPYLSQAYNARAWQMATCPDEKFIDAKQAIEDAKRACKYTNWRDDIPIGTLAAAYARAGDYKQAIQWLDNASKTNPYRFKEIRSDMKKQFEAKKPYTDKPKAG